MAKYKETSMAAVFQNQAEKYGDRRCVKSKKGGSYIDISWNEMATNIKNLAYYLLSLGVKKGDKVGLFSANRHEWWIVDMAILSIGAVNVPLYSTNSSEEAFYILNNSESKACLVGDEAQLEKVLKVKKKLPKVKNIVMIDEMSSKKKDVVQLEDALKKGEAYKSKGEFDKRINAIKAADMAAIIYTSGTTGDPKGVMLTHGNLYSNVSNTLLDVKHLLTEEDVYLSFLPLNHVLERTAGYGIPIMMGATVAFAENMTTLMENFQEVRPNIIISVPRIYEKVHAAILSKVADSSPIKKAIFNFAINTAKKNLPYICEDRERKGLFATRYNLANKLVFSNLFEALGMDKMNFAISGGGPLSVSDAEFFLGMGLPILEGFGLTETSPITNYNRPGEIKVGSVGRSIQETEVKISEEGEVLIKGPQVMKGYYKNPKATKEVFTKDKFFKTGDLGVIDEKGRLSITGRIKDIIVTAGGKNISPQNIENSIKTSAYIEQIGIIGDKRKYLSALVIPAFEELAKWAKRNGISFEKNADLIENDEVSKLIAAEIEKYTKQYARVEQIRKFKLLDAEWTQETDELTPTQKVKRKVVSAKYANEIEAMYPPE
ncbi:MAG: long-chain fatty acid--CoA ligase [bacterium]|nr:long-chain fatty acid--CoA ligase [bacterium]